MAFQRNSIEVLDGTVIEKIAAGEVIERPASVLKELIENAIDAAATKIEIQIENAGFSRIAVTDNGCGMPAVDLDKCVLRYATSKIRTADDLFAVTTMGFRGEALSSIAAVSRLTITTSSDRGGLGCSIRGEGGIFGASMPAAHAQGTSVDVRDLFFNVPARKKFMKSVRSEQLAAARVVEQLAVPFPAVQFSLVADGSLLFDLPVVNSLDERIAAVAGNEMAKSLIECRGSRAGMEAVCFVSSPQSADRRPRFQSLYVNLRRVDCDAVTFAVRAAFERFLGGGIHPSFFCFIDSDPTAVDVNVHPSKQQVKFADERSLSGFIFSTVKDGIAAAQSPDIGPRPQEYAFPGRLKESVAAAEEPFQESMSLSRTGGTTLVPFPSTSRGGEKEIDRTGVDAVQLSKVREDSQTQWNLISCYQIHETYILAPIKNGVLIIDQHAAHERVLFEQALADVARGRSASQQLLFPAVIELTAVEKAVVQGGDSFFRSFGFDFGDFGGTTISVSAIPFFMRTGDVEASIRSMVRYLIEEKDRDAVNQGEKRFAAAFACGAAIKAGQKLTQEEMNALVNSLFASGNPYTCPHGRPTLVRISLEELNRRFLR